MEFLSYFLPRFTIGVLVLLGIGTLIAAWYCFLVAWIRRNSTCYFVIQYNNCFGRVINGSY